MKIKKFLPAIVLQPFVKEFLIIESDTGLDSKIIPDTSIVIAIRYKGNVTRWEDGEKVKLPNSVVTGIRRSARLMAYEKQTANLLIILKEGGIAAFSKVPAHELFDQSIAAEDLFPSAEVDAMVDRIASAELDEQRIAAITAFLQKHLVKDRQHTLVGEAIHLIRQQNGIVRIKNIADALHISQDPFEKRFRAMIGATPKQYASIIRLRHLINNHSTYSSLTEAAYEAGYFDQSHFIKDFRLFTGQSPKDFFRSPLFW